MGWGAAPIWATSLAEVLQREVSSVNKTPQILQRALTAEGLDLKGLAQAEQIP